MYVVHCKHFGLQKSKNFLKNFKEMYYFTFFLKMEIAEHAVKLEKSSYTDM